MAITVAAGEIILADHHNNLVPLIARKTADETVNNSATMQDDNDMVLAVAANATYQIEGAWYYNTGTTPDIKMQFTFPAGLTMFYVVEGVAVSTSVLGQFKSIQTTVSILEGVAGDRIATIEGLVIVSSTAGNLRVQWAQNTANASDTKMLAGSYIKLMRLT